MKPSYLVVFIIIITIVGVSIAIPAVYFSESYSAVLVEDDDWTPSVSDTPTQTKIVASLTFTPQKKLLSTASSSPKVKPNCIYPVEYWEEHPDDWLEMLVGNTMYGKDEIHQIFTDPSDEIHLQILKQLYLANLNIFYGADSTVIELVLGETNNWLQKYSQDQELPEEIQQVGIQLAQSLAEFNSGLIGPGFCPPYEALTVTPEVIKPTETHTPTNTPTNTSTATRVFVTLRPTVTSTKIDKEPKPTARPTKDPQPTDPPPPPPPTEAPTSAPPEPTEAPTSVPPEKTIKPTDPPQPTNPDDKATPTPAS